MMKPSDWGKLRAETPEQSLEIWTHLIARQLRDIARTLNLQAHLFALYLAADEGPESMIGPKLSDICAELAKQGQYMNGGKS